MRIEVYNLLKDNYSELYSISLDINDLVFTAPHTVIVKSRVYIELLSKEIAKLEKIEELNTCTLAERLKRLNKLGIIDEELSYYFNEIRKIGNVAAHEEIEGELELALKVHKVIYKITGWFVETYLDYNFKTPIYKSPVPESNVEKTNSNIIMKLIGKVDDLLNSNREKEDKVDIKKEVYRSDTDDTQEIKESESLFINKSNTECLVEELSKLKESSKEAVEGLNIFTPFKKYMHVDRNAQIELEKIILEANNKSAAQLILVCGSVGDGKSHIISYFKNKFPDIMRNFKLHNDATESLEPSKTSTDTLNELLENFTDDKIELSDEKLILAINLGTLNNFIDSEYSKRFSKLKQFVSEKKILEKSISDNNFDPGSNIQFVNFSDYSLYTLKDGKIESEYIKSLIKRITDKSEINIFYKSYKDNCTSCKNKNRCPIKSNYELLSEENTQDAIVDLLVQCIIKNKIIISTRALLNFIYDLLIARTYIDVNSKMFKDDIAKLKNQGYINSLTPNIIFEHEELSFIFKALNTLDPLNIRNREVDDFIIKFNNSVNILDFFDEYIDYPKGYISRLHSDNFEEKLDKKTKKELLKLFIRSYYLCGKRNLFNLRDEVYEDFIRYVYYWNKGDKSKLKGIYSDIKDGILKWNGEACKNQINIFIGKNQIKYKISEELELRADTTNLPLENKESKLEKFLTEIEIKYKGEGTTKSFGINVDYPLYELLKRVGNGYRPNKKDKNYFIKFIEFMNKIEISGSQKKQLTFIEKNREDNKKFRLEYDDEFEIYRFVEI